MCGLLKALHGARGFHSYYYPSHLLIVMLLLLTAAAASFTLPSNDMSRMIIRMQVEIRAVLSLDPFYFLPQQAVPCPHLRIIPFYCNSKSRPESIKAIRSEYVFIYGTTRRTDIDKRSYLVRLWGALIRIVVVNREAKLIGQENKFERNSCYVWTLIRSATPSTD